MSADADEIDSRERHPVPPRTVTDGEGRTIDLRVADAAGDDRAALKSMYEEFGAGDRAQGIPPADPDRRERWLDRIREGVGVLAWHGDRAVGHGVLLAGGPGHELALFVRPGYRGAGVGTALLHTLLGRGRTAGVETVWLSVQRTNRPAVQLYRKAGFSPAPGRGAPGAGELEMERTL